MLFSARFVKIGAGKAMLFFWVLMKLHFHVYLKPVYFGSKERRYEICVLPYALQHSAIYHFV